MTILRQSRPTAEVYQRPLKIAIITENWLPKIDGVTRTLARLLEHLAKEGHHAMLFGPEGGMSTFHGHEVVGTRGIPLICYPGLSLNFFRPRFLQKLKEFEPDVIHYVDPIWLCAQAQPFVRHALSDVPAVASYHTNIAGYAGLFGYEWLTNAIWSLQRRLHASCVATFCPSPSTKRMLEGRQFRNVELWTRGADTEAFNPAFRCPSLRQEWRKHVPSVPGQDTSSEAGMLTLLYVGRVSYEKNIGLLIHAFRALSESVSNCQLIIVGDGPARAELEKSCRDLNVFFSGYKTGQELSRHYASADIFAFPSASETFGQVVLEAMASGLPVVGLKAEGVCDTVQDRNTGLLLDLNALPGAEVTEDHSLPPANAVSLLKPGSKAFPLAVERYAGLLEKLAKDQQLRMSLSTNAIAYARTQSWKEAMNRLVLGYKLAAWSAQEARATRLDSSSSTRSSGSSSLSSSSSPSSASEAGDELLSAQSNAWPVSWVTSLLVALWLVDLKQHSLLLWAVLLSVLGWQLSRDNHVSS